MENTLLTAFDVVWTMFGFMLVFITVVIPCIGIIRWLLDKRVH